MDNKIKNIVFDFGGVIIDIDPPQCVEAFHQLGFGKAEELIGKYRQGGVFLELEQGNVSSEVFCQTIRHETSQPVTDEQILRAWNSILLGIDPKKLRKLEELHTHYKLYLLSNTNILHWRATASMWGGKKPRDYFDDLFLSFEMHLSKPDKEIFRSVVNRAGILPHETLLVDDSETNCAVARSLGWQTHCVQPGEDWTTLIQ